MSITKDSVVKMTLAGLLALVVGIWATVEKVQSGFAQISLNTQAIQGVVKSMELSRIDRIIEGKQKEVRDKDVMIMKSAGNKPLIDLLHDQVTKLNHEIEMQKIIRGCVVDPESKICE